MAAKKKTNENVKLISLLCVICLIVGIVAGFFLAAGLSENKFESDVYVSGDLEIHFLELGNKYTGDCTYIKAGETDILIDAGSRAASIPVIDAYLKQYVTDGTLEYVIVTHAHEDHYAGFATAEAVDNLFDLYTCKTIIDFALTNQSGKEGTLYANYVRERDKEIAAGAVHYTAAECISEGMNVFSLGDDMSLEILDSYYYTHTASGENNYSVCTLLRQGSRSFLFTGDLEKEGEEYLVQMNDLPEVTLYKAGHHGSSTSSTDTLLSVIKPEYVCVCCCAGSSEYTSNLENQFPTQAFINRISNYTDQVYVTTLCIDYSNNRFTSMNGNITLISTGTSVEIRCSGSSDPLANSEWFKTYRDCPETWKKKE